MGRTFLASVVVLTALSSSCASPEQPLTCNDLARIQRGTEEALKEIAQAQRQKEVDQCQTLDENQTKVKLAVAKLEGRLEQGLNDRLALNQMERCRLDDIEAKVETLQTVAESNKEVSLELKKSTESLSQSLAIIETKVDTQGDELKTVQASSEERLQVIEDSLKAMQEQLTRVVSRLACQPPFEVVGDDCVHVHDVGMTWADARRYCQALGGDLLEPTDKTGFVLDGRFRKMSAPHPPLFDLLERKRNLLDPSRAIVVWVGASVDDDGSEATWTSGQALTGDYSTDPRDCIRVVLWDNGNYDTGSVECANTYNPLCHRL